MSRFSFGDRPSSQALRACTQRASAPAAKTLPESSSSATSGSWSSTPIRHLTVTGIFANDSLHRRHTFGDKVRRLHQAGAERAGLHAVGRAADVQIDLVIAERLADARGLGKLGRIGAAKLQRHRMLGGVETKQPLAGAMDDGIGHYHLGVKQRTPRELAMEEPAMAVGPVHHGRHGQSMILIFQHFFFNIKSLEPAECTRIYARIRPFSPRFDLSVHTERTRKNGHLH